MFALGQLRDPQAVDGLLGTLSAREAEVNNYGAGDRTRTDDLLITNQLLYQLSYAGLTLEKPLSYHVVVFASRPRPGAV